MPYWADLYKVWKGASTPDPISRREISKEIEGAGVTVPDAIPDIRNAGEFLSGSRGVIKLRDSNDFIDLSSITNRQSRYKEYERLRTVAEINTAMTVFADESCVVGSTPIATPWGFITIKELAETKSPDEKFLVYCYDFKKQDYTLGWAFHPRLVKRAQTILVMIDDGSSFICTSDHRALLANGEWIQAGQLKEDDELMPFYRISARPEFTKNKKKQFARIWTKHDGWKHERAFIEEWKTGKVTERHQILYKILRAIEQGLNTRQVEEAVQKSYAAIQERLFNEGFSYKEAQRLADKPKTRRVLSVFEHKEEDVYDLSVMDHENFASDTTIFHNCQIGENGHMFDISCKNLDVKEELEWLFFHPQMMNVDENLWDWARNLYLFGDHFLEMVIDPNEPKMGVLKVQKLPPDSMYRIETIKGKLVEFQQAKEGPDYQSLSRVEVTKATEAELAQATAIRFAPESVVHFRIGGDVKTFYPYGVSLVEAARGPAHQLRLMEDAMLVYRLTRAPERRVFYIDVGQLPPFKAEAFMTRLQDQFRKKKTFSTKGDQGFGGASPVEERWQAPSQDEDYWIPLRPNSTTRVETLPGAQNLGEIDDALYFRNKLFIALNFPKNYMAQEDVQITRTTLSSVDVKFARLVERLQQSLARGMTEIAIRHLELRGFPTALYDDLQVKLTAPSHYRELSENEVIEARYNRAAAIKGTGLMADLDVLIEVLKLPTDKAKEIVARSTVQKLQDVKLQILSQNPQLLGIAMPGQGGTEMGAEAGGPTPMMGEQPGQPPTGIPGTEPAPPALPGPKGMAAGEEEQRSALDTYGQPPKIQAQPLPEPSQEDIIKFDLDILDYSREGDEEEIDPIELDEI